MPDYQFVAGRRPLGDVDAVGNHALLEKSIHDAHRLERDGLLGLIRRGSDVVGAVDVRQAGELAIKLRLARLGLTLEYDGGDPNAARARLGEQGRLIDDVGSRGIDEQGSSR